MSSLWGALFSGVIVMQTPNGRDARLCWNTSNSETHANVNIQPVLCISIDRAVRVFVTSLSGR